jgi:hypothetical protein
MGTTIGVARRPVGNLVERRLGLEVGGSAIAMLFRERTPEAGEL